MPKRPEGVYSDWNGGWYFKVTVGADPLPGSGTEPPCQTSVGSSRNRTPVAVSRTQPRRDSEPSERQPRYLGPGLSSCQSRLT
jgi:hypothetical protein